MAQPQPVQRMIFTGDQIGFINLNYLEQVPELQPDPVVESSGPGPGSSGPNIGCEDPEPPSRNTFQPNDVF